MRIPKTSGIISRLRLSFMYCAGVRNLIARDVDAPARKKKRGMCHKPRNIKKAVNPEFTTSLFTYHRYGLKIMPVWNGKRSKTAKILSQSI